MENKSFAEFQEITKEPHNVPIWLQRTVNRFGDFKGTAYDLGCGAGNETIYLLEKGWKVIAVDREIDVINKKQKNLKQSEKENLKLIKQDLKDLEWQDNVDFIVSINTLSWCSPNEFKIIWKNIYDSLKIGGRIAITLFGENDDFKKFYSNMTFFTKEEILMLLENFQIEGKTEDILEKEYDGKTANGKSHHWHFFIIMAKKVK